MSGGELLAEGVALLAAAGVEDAESAAGWWMAEALGAARHDLPGLAVSEDDVRRIRDGFRRLAGHEPLQYVIGHAPFLDFTLRTDARALVPRPETEELVGRVLADRAFWRAPGRAVADIGTGTGCIAIALARACPDAQVWAVDRAAEALALARENADGNGVGARIHFLEADLLAPFAPESLDLVVSNPPYIAPAVIDALADNVRRFEPRMALDGGADGLSVIRRLIEQAFTVLKKRGRLWLEIGEDQGDAVRRLLEQAGFDRADIHRDMYQHIRFAEAVK